MDQIASKSTGPASSGTRASASRAPASLAGCPVHDLKNRLRAVGLRPTRQRVALGWLLFCPRRSPSHGGNPVRGSAARPRAGVARHHLQHAEQFSHVGLLRQIAMDGTKSYFDTNVTDHHHFFVEGEDGLVDIPAMISRSRTCRSRRKAWRSRGWKWLSGFGKKARNAPYFTRSSG